MSLNAQIEDMFSREMASHGRAYTFYSQLDKVLQPKKPVSALPTSKQEPTLSGGARVVLYNRYSVLPFEE